MKKTAGEEGHSLLDMLRKRAFRRLGKFKKATKEGPGNTARAGTYVSLHILFRFQ